MSDWISVTDRLPEEKEEVLGWYGCADVMFLSGKRWWSSDGTADIIGVRYWKPIMPPKD